MKIKNFKSTQSLYGVKPEYFEEMMYFEAVSMKIVLAKEQIKTINEKLDYRLPYEEYIRLNTQLRMCEKAFRFNTELLRECEGERKRSSNE